MGCILRLSARRSRPSSLVVQVAARKHGNGVFPQFHRKSLNARFLRFYDPIRILFGISPKVGENNHLPVPCREIPQL